LKKCNDSAEKKALLDVVE